MDSSRWGSGLQRVKRTTGRRLFKVLVPTRTGPTKIHYRAREKARRRRQIAKGMLQVTERKTKDANAKAND